MRKMVLLIVLIIFSANALNADDYFSSPQALKDVRTGISLMKKKFKANGISFPYWNGTQRIVYLSQTKVEAEWLDARYGSLQNTIVNLQLPTGTISNKVNWANLLFIGDRYLLSSKDIYEYYYRVYQIISFRMFYITDANNNFKFNGDNTGIGIEFTNGIAASSIFKGNKLYKGWNDVFSIITGLYPLGHSRRFTRKAFFNYILFTGTMLNDLSNDSFAKKYFKKFESEWSKLRAILNEIKKENGDS